MTTINFSLSSYPLVTTLGGISWVKDLRGADSVGFASVVDGKKPGQFETRAMVVGELDDYTLYFLTSRARVRLARMPYADGGYMVFDRDADGALSQCRFLLEADMPQDTNRPQARATLKITSEVREIIQKAGGTQREIEGVSLPKEGYFSNAIAFNFVQDQHPIGPVAFQIVPALSKFISFDDPTEAAEFCRLMNYEIYYIGQASNIETRLNAHEKIRAMADILLTKRLDHEPVVFCYTFKCDQKMDAAIALDLIEAALISHFKPALNIDKRNFPKAKSISERGLERKLQAVPFSRVTVDRLGHLYGTSIDRAGFKFLSDGFGITFDDSGKLSADSLGGISIGIK